MQDRRYLLLPVVSFLAGAVLLFSATTLAGQSAVDPGPRPNGTAIKTSTSPKFTFTFNRTVEPRDALGADGAGNLLGAGTGTLNQGGFWADAINVFAAKATVLGGPDNITGLGPGFNGESCFQCHSQPTIGGTSGPVNFQADPNFVHDHGATNAANLSPFISSSGPVREARFGADGGVHELFSIQGRDDAPTGCTLQQDDFQSHFANGDLFFRIPTPLFGLGFVENTPELTLQQNLDNEQVFAVHFFTPALGISGHFNTNGNDGTISRFGWKAQNKSLLLFSGEASNVELGVTNELFQTEKVPGAGCAHNKLPEDNTLVLAAGDPALNNPVTATAKIASDIENFAIFMRLNGAPGQCAFNSGPDKCFSLTQVGGPDGQTSQDAVNSIQRGKALFGTIVPDASGNPKPGIGCVLCHTDVLTTGPSFFPALDQKQFRPFSDFAVHQMDLSLADVMQGTAQTFEFRTAPLWGIGQRLFFLQDGRANDLLTAIVDHAPQATTVTSSCFNNVSEACGVIVLFNQLPPVTPAGTATPSQQDILNFLRSL